MDSNIDSKVDVIFSLPKSIIDFMFSKKRDIFVKYTAHDYTKKSKLRLGLGSKLYFYQSDSKQLVVGEAIIKKIEFLLMEEVLNRYYRRIIMSVEQFKQYSKKREYKRALVLKLETLIRYKRFKKTLSPVNMGGYYITKQNEQKVFK